MKAALVVLAACASPHADPPANHATAPPGVTSHFVLLASPLYAECGKVHHVQVLVDGTLRATAPAQTTCTPMHQIKPGLSVSDPDFGHVDRSEPFDVPPGHHRIEVRDVEAKVGDATERDFPVYDDQHRVTKELAASAADDKLSILGFAYEFIVSPIKDE